MTYGSFGICVCFRVVLTSKKLGIFHLNDDRLDRLKLIKRLSDEGLTSKEISHFLNSHNIRTPKGLEYYPKLVWVTLNKYQKRLLRTEMNSIDSVEEWVSIIGLSSLINID